MRMHKNLLILLVVASALVFASGCIGTVTNCVKQGDRFVPTNPQSICCPGLRANYENTVCERQFADWVSISLSALVLIFMIVSLIMGFAFATNFKELYAWGKNELFQILATAIIVGAAFAVVNASDILSGFMLAGIRPDPSMSPTAFGVAESYLKLNSYILFGQYVGFSAMNIEFGKWASMTLSLMPARVGFRLQPALVLRPIMDANAMMLNALGLGLASIYGQMALLSFVKEKMFALFLPIGIILRSFPFTRSKGSAIIAIALGFYIIFPLTFYLDVQVLKNYCYVLNVSELKNCAVDSTKVFFSEIWRDINSNLSRGTWEGLSFMLFWFFMWPSKPVFLFTGIVFGMASLIFWFVIILGFVLPFINILITLTFTREIAKLLGGDVNISALTKIV